MLPNHLAEVLKDACPLALLLNPLCEHVAVEGAQLGRKLVHLQGVEEVAHKGELVSQLEVPLFLLQSLVHPQLHPQQYNVVLEQECLLLDQFLVVGVGLARDRDVLAVLKEVGGEMGVGQLLRDVVN